MYLLASYHKYFLTSISVNEEKQEYLNLIHSISRAVVPRMLAGQVADNCFPSPVGAGTRTQLHMNLVRL